MKFTTARITGLLYLGLAITGMLAFLFVKDKLFVDGDAVATTANLATNQGLARFGVAAEVALVAFQALTAVWFFKLFRKKDSFTAGLIGVFGTVNAVVILISAAMWLSAIAIASKTSNADVTYMLFRLHNDIWVVGGLFFGLWLLPMAYMARVVKMPRLLVWFLATGGIGYILSTFVAIFLPDQTVLINTLPITATFGELWIIGYLLFKRVEA